MKRKSESNKNWLQDLFDDVERRRGTYIKSRYYVVEITPSKPYWSGDGHGGSEREWTNTKVVQVSDYFYTKKPAETFIEEHDPDDGNTLEIKQDKLYRRTVEEWF